MRTAAEITTDFGNFLNENTKTQYEWDHKVRYWETFQRLAPLLREGARIVELGGASMITRFLGEVAGFRTTTYGEDLRYTIDLPTDAYDVVLLLEVVEHLKDRASVGYVIGELATFTFSGAQSVASEIYRMLRPGGCVLVTTPNLSSLDTIGKALEYKHPFQYHPHVREYTIEDIRTVFEGVGFETRLVETADSWNPPPYVDRARIRALLEANGYSTDLRGDDAFFVFAKP